MWHVVWLDPTLYRLNLTFEDGPCAAEYPDIAFQFYLAIVQISLTCHGLFYLLVDQLSLFLQLSCFCFGILGALSDCSFL